MVWSSWGKSWGGGKGEVITLPPKIEYEIAYVANPMSIVFPTITINNVKDEIQNNVTVLVWKREIDKMIKIDPNSENILEFDIDVAGIDPLNLEYHLRLYCEGYHLGFKGRYNDKHVTFQIPVLSGLMTEVKESMRLKFEVNDKTGKFYLNPFNEDINVEPKIEVKASIKENTKESDVEVKVSVREVKKPTQFNKIFE